MKRNVTKFVCVNALIAALYVVFTMPFGTITTSSGLQFRPAEALTILPALCPYTVLGLTIGCAISNTVSAFGIFDIVLGSLTTLLAGIITATKPFRRSFLAPLPPILLNALILPAVWVLGGGETGIAVYAANAASLLLTQSAVIYGLGVPLYYLAKKKLMPYMELESAEKKQEQN